ncbi:MAG: T9SS type A sorting domain-containing protein, partial [Bacteroidales bacterium]
NISTQLKGVYCLIVLVLISVIFSLHSIAYDRLYINDPHGSYRQQGNIIAATITVHPKGVYAEIGLYLTFSAKDSGLDAEDELEVVLNFSLPENSVVHDSWLWIDDSIVKAEILDRWTASEIYEGIVQRRRDPSLLTKNGNQDYELQIYPLPGNSSRSCKIAYLVPVQWTVNSVYIPLPANIINTSYEIPNIEVLTIETEEWSNPVIQELDDLSFDHFYLSFYNTTKHMVIKPSEFKEDLNVKFDSPLNNGVYLNTYKKEDEGVYQLAFLPSCELAIESSNKICILFDYDVTKSTYTDEDVLKILKLTLLDNFNERDSFNIIFSGINPALLSQDWIPGDSASIKEYFNSGIYDLVTDYSDMPSVLSEGIEFIESHDSKGEILIIANSDNLGQYSTANAIYSGLKSMTDPLPVIHIINFNNTNYTKYYQGGSSYYGNDYLYIILSKRTGGNYFGYFSDYSLNTKFSKIFQSFGGLINSFDLYTTLSNGFCFSRYNLNNTENVTYLYKPVISIGKYHGSGSFNIQASGVFKSETFTIESTIEEGDIRDCDSIAEISWTGNYIEFLESGIKTNDIITEIIDFSMEYRVLSLYTAFLTLDPKLEISSVKENINNVLGAINIKAYPNPFKEYITFNIELPEINDLVEMTINIYNLYGQIVKTFAAEDYYANNKIEVVWDGTTNSGELASVGIYFMVVNTSRHTAKIKIVKM